MADCSELSKLIADSAMNIGSREDIQSLDDVIARLQEIHPELHRDAIVQAIVETSTRQTKERSEISKKLSALKRQAKKESVPVQRAKLEKQITELQTKLETGDILPKERIETPLHKDLERLHYERDLLKDKIRNEIYDLKPKTIWGRIGDFWDFERLLQTTGELSFALRQLGVFAGTHPIQWSEATVKALWSLKDPLYRRRINAEILNRELAPIAYRAGVHMIPVQGGVPLSQQEEYLMSNWATRIPIIKEFTEAGVTLINLVRASHFDTLYKTLGITDSGLSAANAEFLANAVNVMSGRGRLGAKGDLMAVGLNRIFYAPKWVASRFEVLYGQPVWHDLRNKDVQLKARAVVAAEYARFFVSLAAFYSLAALAGGELDRDPNSSTFGQIKFGDKTYLDPTMGIGRIIALHFQLAQGKKTVDGRTVKLSPYNKFLEMARYVRGKLGPFLGDFVDVVTGTTIVGEEITAELMAQNFIPITYGDIYDVMKENGIAEGMAFAILAFFGQSIRVHTEQDKGKRRTSVRK